jgi:hypothetical protein
MFHVIATEASEFMREGGFRKIMLTGIRIIGLGIWIAILSMAISAFFFRHGTEEDVTLVFVATMDFIVIGVVVRSVLKLRHKQRG